MCIFKDIYLLYFSYLNFSKICTYHGAEIHFNPNANCAPPTGCNFLSPNTWINGTIPIVNNDDVVLVITPGPLENYLLVISNVSGPGPSFSFGILSMVIQNATVVFDSSILDASGILFRLFPAIAYY